MQISRILSVKQISSNSSRGILFLSLSMHPSKSKSLILSVCVCKVLTYNCRVCFSMILSFCIHISFYSFSCDGNSWFVTPGVNYFYGNGEITERPDIILTMRRAHMIWSLDRWHTKYFHGYLRGSKDEKITEKMEIRVKILFLSFGGNSWRIWFFRILERK